jgi:hypothetical protein
MKRGMNIKNKKENKTVEFFKPSWWKVILTILTTFIFSLYFAPREFISIMDFVGTKRYGYAPIGIENIYLFLLVTIILFYLIFSFSGWIIRVLKNKR